MKELNPLLHRMVEILVLSNLTMEKFFRARGACSGCPSSTITLKSGIENMLKYYIPEITSVKAINQ